MIDVKNNDWGETPMVKTALIGYIAGDRMPLVGH
jgi:hypothetical protein